MQSFSPFIIYPEYTQEDKSSVIIRLRDRVRRKGKVQDAFNRLFGTQPPHTQIERLTRLNSRALTDEYNMRVFRIFAVNPIETFYDQKWYMGHHEVVHAGSWDDGKLIARWEKFTKQPNKHHIVPESRGGNSNAKNFWYIDRLTHNDFHTVFQNLTPIEQLVLLLNIHKDLLSREFSHEIRKVLWKTHKEPECYRQGVIQKNRRNNWN